MAETKTFSQYLTEFKTIKSRYGWRIIVNPSRGRLLTYMQNPNNYPQLRWVLNNKTDDIYFATAYSSTHYDILKELYPDMGRDIFNQAAERDLSLGGVSLVNEKGQVTENGNNMVWAAYVGKQYYGLKAQQFKDGLMDSRWAKEYRIKRSKIINWNG